MGFEKLTIDQIKKDPERQLRNFKREKKFLVAIDTDGCVTDNMNGKQMLIFHPQYMEFYQLWGIESYFREVAEYYNLFSIHRGCNRFIAINFTLKALRTRKDVKKFVSKEKIEIPDYKPVEEYIKFCEEKNLGLGNPSLEQYLNTQPLNLYLYKLLGWSEAVNRTFPFINPKIPPFENVRESMKLIDEMADIIVVSQTPYEDLVNWWETQELTDYVKIIAGQEMGKKVHHIEVVKNIGGYNDDEILMLGDGGGDLKAVKSNNGFFYPIVPTKENESWKKFPEYFKFFTEGKYKKVEEKLIEEFKNSLLTTPPWERNGYDHIQSYREKQEIRKKLYEKLNPQGKLLIL